jgi:hypothetical protein
MKVVALALGLYFAAVPVQAAAKHKGNHASKHSKVKTKSHVKRAKASGLKSANRRRVN